MKTIFTIALLLSISLPMSVCAVTGQLFENEALISKGDAL